MLIRVMTMIPSVLTVHTQVPLTYRDTEKVLETKKPHERHYLENSRYSTIKQTKKEQGKHKTDTQTTEKLSYWQDKYWEMNRWDSKDLWATATLSYKRCYCMFHLYQILIICNITLVFTWISLYLNHNFNKWFKRLQYVFPLICRDNNY